MSRYRRRSGVKSSTRSRSGGKSSRAYSQKYRVSARRKGYGRTSGYYGRFAPTGHSVELKFHDQDVDDTAVAAGATVFTNTSAEATLLRIPQGTSEIQRIGRKCTVKSINWRFNLAMLSQSDDADPAKGDVVRVILYLDKQCNGAAPTNLQILETADYQSFNNLANKSRFRTLMDRTYVINLEFAQVDGTNTAAYAETNIQDSFFKKCNIPIEYNSTAGAIAEIRSNNINMLICSKNGTTQFLSKMRIRFSDS